MHDHTHHEDNHRHGQHGSTDQNGNILTCSVMEGIPVDKEEAEANGWVREYKQSLPLRVKGKKYYFCCSSCPEMFDANPETYA